MDGDSYALLAGIVETEALGSAGDLAPALLDRYWSGEISLPSAIDADIASYLSQHDLGALARASTGLRGIMCFPGRCQSIT